VKKKPQSASHPRKRIITKRNRKESMTEALGYRVCAGPALTKRSYTPKSRADRGQELAEVVGMMQSRRKTRRAPPLSGPHPQIKPACENLFTDTPDPITNQKRKGVTRCSQQVKEAEGRGQGRRRGRRRDSRKGDEARLLQQLAGRKDENMPQHQPKLKKSRNGPEPQHVGQAPGACT